MNKFSLLTSYQQEEFIKGTKFAKAVYPFVQYLDSAIDYTKRQIKNNTLKDDKVYYEGILYVLKSMSNDSR